MVSYNPDKCPNCDTGILRRTGQKCGEYPLIQCDNCTTGGLLPVKGLEPPFKLMLRLLHEVGCEPGRPTE